MKIDKDYYYDKDFLENFENKIAADRTDNIAINKERISSPTLNLIEIVENPVVKPKDSSVNSLITAKKEKNILRTGIQSATVESFEKILNNNIVFAKEGDSFVKKLSQELEDDIAKSHPKIDWDYKNTLANMTKTVKELERYHKVSSLIVKGKLNIVKVAKFPYGSKYIEKLKKYKKDHKINK